MKQSRQTRRGALSLSPIASLVTVLALLPLSAAASSPKPTGKALLCNQGRVICVSASLPNSLLANPLTVDVQVNSPGDVDVDWELRDSQGRVLDYGSTEDLLDWPGDNSSRRRTLHLMDFILKPASSGQGTLTLTPNAAQRDGEGQELPQLVIPVRLSTERSVVTILEPEDPNRFHEDYFNWANTHISSQSAPYRTDMPFTVRQVEVMYFDSKVAVGATAAVVINRFQGEAPWRLTHWSLVGNTAHVRMDGTGWSGVGNYVSMLNYVLRRSVLSIPGVEDYVCDR